MILQVLAGVAVLSWRTADPLWLRDASPSPPRERRAGTDMVRAVPGEASIRSVRLREPQVDSETNQTPPGKAKAPTPSGPPIPPPRFPTGSQFLAAGSALALTLETATADGVIRFTTNGDPVIAAAPRYPGPLALANTLMVRARVFVEGRAGEEAIRTYFFGVEHNLPSDVPGPGPRQIRVPAAAQLGQ